MYYSFCHFKLVQFYCESLRYNGGDDDAHASAVNEALDFLLHIQNTSSIVSFQFGTEKKTAVTKQRLTIFACRALVLHIVWRAANIYTK